jgi:hypothetical protein
LSHHKPDEAKTKRKSISKGAMNTQRFFLCETFATLRLCEKVFAYGRSFFANIVLLSA